MSGNWVEYTTSTGGTGTLTLTELAGAPSLQDILGTTGTRWINYTIQEWASGVYSGPPAKAEHGIGSFVLSTGVLTRTKLLSTWNGTTYVVKNPSALSFGTTAANIRVNIGQSAELTPDVIPFFNTATPGLDIGIPSAHCPVGAFETQMGSADMMYFTPYKWVGCGEIISVGVGVTLEAASSAVKVGLYEIASTGLPGNRLFDLTGGTPIATIAPGHKTVTCSFHLPPGWYYACVVSNNAFLSLRAYRVGICGTMTGVLANLSNIAFFMGMGSYTTGLPATAPAAGSLTADNTSGGPAIYLKPRN